MTRRATTNEGRKLTVSFQLIAALKHRGCVKVEDPRVSKYEVFSHPDYDGRFYYIGRYGALRSGPTVRGSIGLSDGFKTTIINAWRASQKLPLIKIDSFESRSLSFVIHKDILTNTP